MRVEKVRRFLDVQKQIQRAAEWTLHELRQEQHRLQEAQQDLVAALGREDALSIWLAPAVTRQLGRLAADETTVAAAGEQQKDLVLEQTGRLKHAERLERTLDAERGRERERAVLEDVIDLTLAGSRLQ